MCVHGSAQAMADGWNEGWRRRDRNDRQRRGGGGRDEESRKDRREAWDGGERTFILL